MALERRTIPTNMLSSTGRPNSPLTYMFRRLCGVTYCFFWFFSILSGFFLLISPAIPLAFIAPKIYRKWGDIVFGMWEPFPVAMMEILFKVRVHLSGDYIDPSEGGILIMNHRTRLDWNFLWAGVYHGGHPHCHSLKFILKAPIMHIPGPGWVMQACSFLFIHRNWEKDQQLLSNSLNFLGNTERSCQILIFPEGTDLTDRSLEKSHQYALKNNMQRFFKVLHPKTTGFTYLVREMRKNGQLRAVYDFTVGYPKTLPETELDMVRGNFPEEIHFNIKRYEESSIPNTDEEIKDWLNAIWKEKEMKLRRFYSSGSFTNQDFTPDCQEQNNANEIIKKQALVQNLCSNMAPCQCSTSFNKIIGDHSKHSHLARSNYSIANYQPGNVLYLALIFWYTLTLLNFYLLFFNGYYEVWVCICSIAFFLFSYYSDGFHQVLANFHNKRSPVQVSKKLY